MQGIDQGLGRGHPDHADHMSLALRASPEGALCAMRYAPLVAGNASKPFSTVGRMSHADPPARVCASYACMPPICVLGYVCTGNQSSPSCSLWAWCRVIVSCWKHFGA